MCWGEFFSLENVEHAGHLSLGCMALQLDGEEPWSPWMKWWMIYIWSLTHTWMTGVPVDISMRGSHWKRGWETLDHSYASV